MAEARNISSADDMYQVLADSGLFSRIERVSGGNDLKCYDSANHLLVSTVGCSEIFFYADATNHIPGNSLGSITHAYLCESGVILTKFYSGTMRCVFVLTRTNTGAACMVFVDVDDESWNAVTWGDVTPLRAKVVPTVQTNQYALMPYVTNAALGIDSYTPDAFYAVAHTGNMLPRSFEMHGRRWFAVDTAVLRDDPAPAG